MKTELEDNLHVIKSSVNIYLIGTLCFFAFTIFSIWLGYYAVCYHETSNVPVMFSFFALIGIILLYEMLGAFRLKKKIPDEYRLIKKDDYPALFDVLNEVTSNLKLSDIQNVYVCPNTDIEVFIQPQLRNLLSEPQRNLVIGMGLLSQLDDDELRAVLYQNLGHYVINENRKRLHVYTICQFASSYMEVKKSQKNGPANFKVRMQFIVFTYFTMWICRKINKAYKKLSLQMEFDADDVAIKYVGADTLERAVKHLACATYNYNVMEWGSGILRNKGVCVQDKYKALELVGKYSQPSEFMYTATVMHRIERLEGNNAVMTDKGTCNVKRTMPELFSIHKNYKTEYSAEKFAEWMHDGFKVYEKQIEFEKSVKLEIHLDSRKHPSPRFEGYYKLVLDDKVIGTGNFVKGYTKQRTISPGKHILTAYAPTGILSVPFEFVAEAYKSYRIDMDYKQHSIDGLYDVFGEKITMLD